MQKTRRTQFFGQLHGNRDPVSNCWIMSSSVYRMNIKDEGYVVMGSGKMHDFDRDAGVLILIKDLGSFLFLVKIRVNKPFLNSIIMWCLQEDGEDRNRPESMRDSPQASISQRIQEVTGHVVDTLTSGLPSAANFVTKSQLGWALGTLLCTMLLSGWTLLR